MADIYTSGKNPQDELFKPVDIKKPNYIKVIGVGGGGGNAVNHMMEEGIQGVDFILCNTDHQALLKSNVKTTVHLGKRELGAGNDPNIGREAAEMSRDEIDSLLDEHTKMLFVTAGMGGGTGTGAAPVVAKLAKDKGILTVGIVTMPMEREGRRRKLQAMSGIEELKKCVDTLILISTDKLRDQYGNMKLSEAFKKADNVLATAARGIAEIITVPGYVNVDFEDVKTVMKDSGKAIMGSGIAEGDGRAEKAIKDAIHSPLLNDSDIEGAKNILLYITSGTNEVSLDEVDEILEIAQNACGNNSDVIWGNGTDESLGDAISVTLIATGFNHDGKPISLNSNNKVRQETILTPKKIYGLDGSLQEGTATQPTMQTETPVIEPSQQSINETPQVEPMGRNEGKTVHDLFSIETLNTIEPKDDARLIEENPAIENEDPIFEPTTDPMPAPIQETPQTSRFEDERPVVRIFENPFMSSNNDDNGFEITSRVLTKEETSNRASQETTVLEAKKTKEIDPKEQLKKQRLRALSMNFRTDRGLEELENQPAYLRRNVEISHGTADADMSHYSTSKNGISSKNSFLHDNVD